MEANQPPETLENILRVTRTQESVLNAYYTDSNGEVVTMTLYDISETDPTDILGDDVLNSGAASRAGSERRDSSASGSRFEESRRYHFRPHPSHCPTCTQLTTASTSRRRRRRWKTTTRLRTTFRKMTTPTFRSCLHLASDTKTTHCTFHCSLLLERHRCYLLV